MFEHPSTTSFAFDLVYPVASLVSQAITEQSFTLTGSSDQYPNQGAIIPTEGKGYSKK